MSEIVALIYIMSGKLVLDGLAKKYLIPSCFSLSSNHYAIESQIRVESKRKIGHFLCQRPNHFRGILGYFFFSIFMQEFFIRFNAFL
jgi:hypothetical protein